MTRSSKLALSLVLVAGAVAPAFAQDNFPDVPANHWAYEALARLKKDGLLVGYPDGLYRGGRPASRYELAVAIHAVYTNLKNVTDALDAQIKALGGNNNNPDLKAQLDSLQNQINALKGYGDDIAALKRATDTFDKELKSLGVDVEAMKKDLGDLADRVSRLEKRKPAVDISGDVNIWIGAGNSRDGLTGLTVDGRPTGVSSDGGVAGMTRDVTILHEAAFTLAGTNETGAKWKGTLVIGNLLGTDPTAGHVPGGPFGSMASLPTGRYSEGASDVYLNDLSVKFDTSLAGLAFNAEVGRLGYKVSPYILQRPDFTSYYSNERWDNGLYYFDGAVLGFNFGGAKVDVFGGRNSQRYSTNSVDLNNLAIGNNLVAGNVGSFGMVDRSLGANVNIPLSTNGNLNLAYLFLDSDLGIAPGFAASSGEPANRLNVFGGDAEFGFGKIKLSGGYHKSDLSLNTTSVNNSDNTAWDAKLEYTGDKFGLGGGYREVEAFYYAPGDWGRLGVLRNPGNIKGFNVGGHLDLSGALRLSANGEFDKGKSSSVGGPFNTDTKIDSYNVRLDFRLNPNLSVYGGYEYTRFKNTNYLTADDESRYQFTTFGLGYGLSANAKLSIQYQISDVRADYLASVNNPGFTGGTSPDPFGIDHRGGFLTTQLSVKF